MGVGRKDENWRGNILKAFTIKVGDVKIESLLLE